MDAQRTAISMLGGFDEQIDDRSVAANKNGRLNCLENYRPLQ